MEQNDTHAEVLRYALSNLEKEHAALQVKINYITALLKESGEDPDDGGRSMRRPGRPKKKRIMSAAARKRIGLAQKKRWAVFHQKKASAR